MKFRFHEALKHESRPSLPSLAIWPCITYLRWNFSAGPRFYFTTRIGVIWPLGQSWLGGPWPCPTSLPVLKSTWDRTCQTTDTHKSKDSRASTISILIYFQEQLSTKREKLSEQLTEAKKLKSNIDKRAAAVSQMLSKYLKPDEFSDYEHFIRTKTRLVMDAREIADKVVVGDEQMAALKESMAPAP